MVSSNDPRCWKQTWDCCCRCHLALPTMSRPYHECALALCIIFDMRASRCAAEHWEPVTFFLREEDNISNCNWRCVFFLSLSCDGGPSCWKIDKCPLNRGHLILFVSPKNCPLYRVAGCPVFSRCLSIEVNGRTVGTFRIVRYSVGVHCWGVSVNQDSTVDACAAKHARLWVLYVTTEWWNTQRKGV